MLKFYDVPAGKIFMPLFAFQFFRYVIVGLLNTALDFLIFNTLSISFGIYSGLYLALINAIAFSVVITQSFFLNKYWTFRSSAAVVRVEFAKFFLVSLGALFINTSIVYVLTTPIGPPSGISPILWENVAKIIALGVNILWNFLGFKFFVFAIPRTQ